jgi:multicomponent K+:H+ antiporter subunit D
VQARPLFDYLARASADLHDPARYARQVLPGPVVPGPVARQETP